MNSEDHSELRRRSTLNLFTVTKKSASKQSPREEQHRSYSDSQLQGRVKFVEGTKSPVPLSPRLSPRLGSNAVPSALAEAETMAQISSSLVDSMLERDAPGLAARGELAVLKSLAATMQTLLALVKTGNDEVHLLRQLVAQQAADTSRVLAFSEERLRASVDEMRSAQSRHDKSRAHLKAKLGKVQTELQNTKRINQGIMGALKERGKTVTFLDLEGESFKTNITKLK